MSKKLLDETSKFLSFVLRHEPQAIGLTLDSEGWADIDALINGAARDGRTLDRTLIENVVASSDKKRFSISPDGQSIRAVQGHSTKSVELQFEEKQPPETLYHGTATRFMDSINEQGLIPGSRHHVHLSQETATASAVGQRYGTVVILQVAARQMQEQGFKFYQAENGVWLTERVPAEFLSTV
ncbi:RNA 2'-phosphotransferase [Pseudomonas sp. FW215-R2]|uniref:RNA 2'-phosphotransferase n=1 Tax=unclassified Pseudomonas TaxID=196821 RepID=UPI000C885659|nr:MULTISPECIES: RNA 2'-phosphotransferase [unclassified Pseudomonas]PMX04038.1 RNA 2'-phosphotransferase [Pseudomonas sp. FW215-R2]PMX12354.1 RNA 2'-phosphotransferase [Pseudomonas sp. FW215-L1]PMX26414.1 RNA 2'-phosphotransferase [Pseudomonas sp. FW215-E1]PNA33145.1 RNA 2'-phosphotransferase [Pseudomonas sp. FW215-R4]